MKRVLILVILSMANFALAWDNITEMDVDICNAMTNNTFLMSEAFTNQLNAASRLGSDAMKSEAYMLLSIHAYENFQRTVDDAWQRKELLYASNAVEVIGMHTNKWQFWMSRFLLAGACCSASNYERAFNVSTNTIHLLTLSGYTNFPTAVEGAILQKFEMGGLEVAEALRVMAGMSAAELGLGNAATNLAHQVPMPYRNTILNFIR